jgi:3-oxoacyl-[acyl-carrier-protein] synthase II
LTFTGNPQTQHRTHSLNSDRPTPLRRRAVITGLGPITCIGTGRDAFWAGIRAGRSGIARIASFDTSEFKAHCGGEIRDWDASAFFPPHRLKRLDRYAQFSVASALLALDDAGLPWSKERPTARVGVSFGTALGGISGAESEHQRFLKKGQRGVNQTLALQVFGGSAHSNIAIECGFRGPGTTNSNSCASGVIAVGEALRYIRDGMADVMIAGGAEAPLSPLSFGAFDFIRTMSRWDGDPPFACKPFDLDRDGFVMGEGAASLVIEEREHAIRRGAHIYGEVLGYTLNNEAHHMTTPLPTGEAVIACMAGALSDAGMAPRDIDYINAHASGTQLNDANECLAIRAVFGEYAARLAVSGTKPFTAHPLGATGAIETVVCALALDRGYIPPTLHYRTPDPACDLDIVPNSGREKPLRFVMNNAFGFGGINAVVVMGRR